MGRNGVEFWGHSRKDEDRGIWKDSQGGWRESFMIPLLIHFEYRENPLPYFGGAPSPATPKCSAWGLAWELPCSTR